MFRGRRLLLALGLTLTAGLGRAGAAAPVPAVAQAQATISVSSRQPWTATGIMLKTGERFSVAAAGAASWRPRRKGVSPEGLPFQYSVCASAQYSGRLFTAPGLNCWSLIGRIGNTNVPFLVGRKFRLTSPTAGQLYLGFNDDAYGDNSGHFVARVVILPRP
jgi:glucose dehydrogenase